MKPTAIIACLFAAGAVSASHWRTSAARRLLTPTPLPISTNSEMRAAKGDSCEVCLHRCNDLEAEIDLTLAHEALERCRNYVCIPLCAKEGRRLFESMPPLCPPPTLCKNGTVPVAPAPTVPKSLDMKLACPKCPDVTALLKALPFKNCTHA